MKKFLATLTLLFVVILFISCNPDMSGKLTGSWIYSTGTIDYKYTFEENTFKFEIDEGSGYVEQGNGTFKASGDKLILNVKQILDEEDPIKGSRQTMEDVNFEIYTLFGISDTELVFMNMFENNVPIVFIGGNTSTLEGKWNMSFGYKMISTTIMKLMYDINFEVKSDGTFFASQEIPEETVSGKWVADGDKLTLSECVYTPTTNNTLSQFFSDSDYTFDTVGNAFGFVKGYGTGYEVKVYTKE